METVIFFIPLAIALAVAFLKLDWGVERVDSFSDWLHEHRYISQQKSGLINKFLSRPFLWGSSKIMDWTEAIENEYFRTAARIALYSYFIVVALYIAFMAVLLVIMALVVLIALWIVFTVVLDSDSPPPRPSPTEPGPPKQPRGKLLRNHKGWYKGKEVWIDDSGNMHDAHSMFGGPIAYVDNDGLVSEGNLIGHEGYVKDDGDIVDHDGLMEHNIGHINPNK